MHICVKFIAELLYSLIICMVHMYKRDQLFSHFSSYVCGTDYRNTDPDTFLPFRCMLKEILIFGYRNIRFFNPLVCFNNTFCIWSATISVICYHFFFNCCNVEKELGGFKTLKLFRCTAISCISWYSYNMVQIVKFWWKQSFSVIKPWNDCSIEKSSRSLPWSWTPGYPRFKSL